MIFNIILVRRRGICMKKGVIASLSMLLGASAGVIATEAMQSKSKIKKSETLKKMGEFYDLLVRWLSLKQEGKSLETYFIQKGYKNIAIYGMKELGERLYDELENSDVKIQYVIDKNAEAIYSVVDVITPDEPFEAVDAIVVTAIHYFEEIQAMLELKTECPIISLSDIVYEL